MADNPAELAADGDAVPPGEPAPPADDPEALEWLAANGWPPGLRRIVP